jgi:hypothetical protein
MSNQVVRINGLVRLAETVRREIGRGVAPQRKSELRDTVARSVAQIDAILKDRGARLAQLALPSRRAYQFLAAIRWDDVKEAQGGDQTTVPSQGIRWQGLTRFVDRITARLAADPDPAELVEIGRAVEQTSRRIEQSIARDAIAPDQLTPATREIRGWLAWLAPPGNLADYRAALHRARAALEPHSNGRRLLIEFRPSRHMYKMTTRHGVSRIILPTPMVTFDDAAFADLAALIFNPHRDAKRRVVEAMRTDAWVDRATELEALGGVVDNPAGAFHDLAASFDRVNAAYFAGQMPRPRITWSRTFTTRKFGHYDHVRDWVMISSSLDRPDVPAFVVDYLMFHELLHKKHGVRWVNGRGHAHTSAFNEDERRFPQYDQADAWLKKLANA